jgi:hypothetical protein
MTNKPEAIEAELVTTQPQSLRSVNTTPKQLRKQMQRDQEMREVINEYIEQNMVAGKDYGTIEIQGKDGRRHTSKPSLFKPGSEKFCGLFKIRATFKKDQETVDMLGNTPGIIAYLCELVDGRGQIVGEGRGTAKADVKGADFDINKQVKIAQKRAQIDAVLRTGGLSDFFTQDMEDAPKDVDGDNTSPPATVKQKNLISKLFLERGAKTPNLLLASIKANGVEDPKAITLAEAKVLIDKLIRNDSTLKVIAYSQAEEEHDDEAHGASRGAGDPDAHGYPGQDEVHDSDMSDEAIEAGLDEAEKELLKEKA